VYQHEAPDCQDTVSRKPKLLEAATGTEALTAVFGERADSFTQALAVAACKGTCAVAQPHAIVARNDFAEDVRLGGMLVRWAPTQFFALPHRLLVVRTFHCMARASTSTTPHPVFWGSLEGVQMRGEGDGCDPLLDDDCDVGCVNATRSILDFMVDPEGVGGTLLIERQHNVDDLGGGWCVVAALRRSLPTSCSEPETGWDGSVRFGARLFRAPRAPSAARFSSDRGALEVCRARQRHRFHASGSALAVFGGFVLFGRPWRRLVCRRCLTQIASHVVLRAGNRLGWFGAVWSPTLPRAAGPFCCALLLRFRPPVFAVAVLGWVCLVRTGLGGGWCVVAA